MLNMKRLAILGLGISMALATSITAQAAVQKPADQIFATQQNTGRNSDGNCSPASAKMILNAYGLYPDLTVQDISEKYGGLGHGGEVLKKLGFVYKYLDNNDTLAKQYLDKGCILSMSIYNGFGPHEGVALDYRTTNGYMEYYILDPSTPNCEPSWAKTSREFKNTLGTVSVSGVYIYNKLEKFSVVDIAKDGHKYNLTLYYDNNNGMFLYSRTSDLEYVGAKTESYEKASLALSKCMNDNILNTTDIIYTIKDYYAMINDGKGNDAYFTLSKDYVAKTWGIVR